MEIKDFYEKKLTQIVSNITENLKHQCLNCFIQSDQYHFNQKKNLVFQIPLSWGNQLQHPLKMY